jgi:para-aminobenzoate synthetase/4-amino-4-deoxychorismate lyase
LFLSPAFFRLGLSPIPVDPTNPFLYHKTTNRQIYDLARSSCTECDDVLLYNCHGEITETSIGNIVVSLRGKLLTPPVTSGLLPGTFRADLLAKKQVEEKVLTIDMLGECEHIYVVNSVRKWREAVIILGFS